MADTSYISKIKIPTNGKTYDIYDAGAARNTAVSPSVDGIMTKEDKVKLDTIEEHATSTKILIVRWDS